MRWCRLVIVELTRWLFCSLRLIDPYLAATVQIGDTFYYTIRKTDEMETLQPSGQLSVTCILLDRLLHNNCQAVADRVAVDGATALPADSEVSNMSRQLLLWYYSDEQWISAGLLNIQGHNEGLVTRCTVTPGVFTSWSTCAWGRELRTGTTITYSCSTHYLLSSLFDTYFYHSIYSTFRCWILPSKQIAYETNSISSTMYFFLEATSHHIFSHHRLWYVQCNSLTDTNILQYSSTPVLQYSSIVTFIWSTTLFFIGQKLCRSCIVQN